MEKQQREELEMNEHYVEPQPSDPQELSQSEILSLKLKPDMTFEDKKNLGLFGTIYVFTGIPIGFLMAMHLLLAAQKASPSFQASLSICRIPLGFKIFFAMFLDSFYSNTIGKRRTYIIPCLNMIGLIFIVFGHFGLEEWINQLAVTPIISLLFFTILLVGITNIAINGWGLASFSQYYVHLAGTCYMIGFSVGQFIGYTLLINITSEYFCQQYLNLNTPLISLNHFLIGLGGVILLYAIILQVCTKEICQEEVNTGRMDGLKNNIRRIFSLFDNQNFKTLIIFLITRRIGLAPILSSFPIYAVENGVPESQFSVLFCFSIITVIISSLFIGKFMQRGVEMTWAYNAYYGLFIVNVARFLIIMNFQNIGGYNRLTFGLIIVVHTIAELFNNFQQGCLVCFIMRVCDPKIGASYSAILFCALELGQSFTEVGALFLLQYVPYKLLSIGGLIFTIFYCLLFKKNILKLQFYDIKSWKIQE